MPYHAQVVPSSASRFAMAKTPVCAFAFALSVLKACGWRREESVHYVRQPMALRELRRGARTVAVPLTARSGRFPRGCPQRRQRCPRPPRLDPLTWAPLQLGCPVVSRPLERNPLRTIRLLDALGRTRSCGLLHGGSVPCGPVVASRGSPRRSVATGAVAGRCTRDRLTEASDVAAQSIVRGANAVLERGAVSEDGTVEPRLPVVRRSTWTSGRAFSTRPPLGRSPPMSATSVPSTPRRPPAAIRACCRGR